MIKIFTFSLLPFSVLTAYAASPTIEWTTASGSGASIATGEINPSIVFPGESFTIRAQGRDSDGDLAVVYIDRNGLPFAHAVAANPSAYISNNVASETAPAVYTAWALDSIGNVSPTIRLTVLPRKKLLGAFYSAWFDSGYPWASAWGVGVTPTGGTYISNSATGLSHGIKLKAIGVDFVAIDNTNNTTWGPLHPLPSLRTDSIFDASKAVISGMGPTGVKAAIMLSIANGNGSSPSVETLLTTNYTSGAAYMFYPHIPSNSGDLFRAKVARVYNEIAYDPAKYQYVDGKPLLLLYTTASGAIYGPGGVNKTPNGKLEGSDLAITISGVSGSPNIADLFTIKWVGALISNSGNSAYVALPDLTVAKNGHWSWEDGYPQSWAKTPTGWLSDVYPESVTVSAYSRAYAGNLLQTRSGGLTFLNQWKRVFEVDPTVVMLHTWNEFSYSGDEPSVAESQSVESNNHYGNNYEIYTREYNRHFRQQRLDVALYDTVGGVFSLYNRRNDYLALATTDFSFTSLVTMYRGTPVAALSGDFNRDGLSELALRNAVDGTVAIRFSPKFSVGVSGDNPAEIVATLDIGTNFIPVVLDFNGDGYSDIAFYNTSSGIFKFYQNNAAGGFVFSHQFTWSVGSNVQIASGDINSDRIVDLIVRDVSTGVVSIGLSNNDMLATAPASIYTFSWAAGAHYQLYVGDFTSDGAADIGLRDSSIGTFYFQGNNRFFSGSTWSFSNQTTFNGPTGSHLLPVVGDFR